MTGARLISVGTFKHWLSLCLLSLLLLSLLVGTLVGAVQASSLFQEDFSGATPGPNKTGVIAGTQFEVTNQTVDIVGELNGTFFACDGNPGGNCLDLAGSPGVGAIRSVPTFDLMAGRTYTVSFGYLLQGFAPGSTPTSEFTVGLGSFSAQLSAIPISQQASLSFTPSANEHNVVLSFTTNTLPDSSHGAVLDRIVLSVVDHYLGYRIKPTKGTTDIFTPPDPATLTERSGASIIFNVKKPLRLYTPANKSGEGVLDEDTHLEAYSLKLTSTDPPQPKPTGRKNVHLQNQFGDLFVDVGKPDRLLVPTAKNLTGPANLPGSLTVDHYRCDAVKTVKGTKFISILGVSIDDQFIADPGKKFDLKQLSRLCTPVKKNDEAPIHNPDTLLLCYKAKISKKEPKHVHQKGVHLHNQFGQEQVDTTTEAEFCVPTTEK